ncbi:hypothetical protein M405DRAFT_858480 [Rhizopogon salebrosus TDB-379]|nr:hypothetical protein M405DRAFT_858480 [Rhizopogon salebrosus TDB-379]
MAVNPNEDTEFNDAPRQYGIIPPKEPTPTTPSPPSSPKLHHRRGSSAQYRCRRQREAQERLHQKCARFGRVYPIGRDDYTREVTEASKVDGDDNDEEKGTGVICF